MPATPGSDGTRSSRRFRDGTRRRESENEDPPQGEQRRNTGTAIPNDSSPQRLIGGEHDIDRERLQTFCLGNASASEVPGEALVDLFAGGTDASVVKKRSRFGAERFGLRPIGSRDDDLGRRPGPKLHFAEAVIVKPFLVTNGLGHHSFGASDLPEDADDGHCRRYEIRDRHPSDPLEDVSVYARGGSRNDRW